jgi:hypothetical protein
MALPFLCADLNSQSSTPEMTLPSHFVGEAIDSLIVF